MLCEVKRTYIKIKALEKDKRARRLNMKKNVIMNWKGEQREREF